MTTLDGILNRRVLLEQPAKGYRVAIDTVFLAAAVPAQAGDKILDLGCGVGGAMLSVACRVPQITGTGLEIQPDLVELCQRNISRNSFASGLKVLQADLSHLPPVLQACFDHALMNPPYHEEAKHDASANAIKRTANTEKEGDLAVWIDAATLALKQTGTLTIIHRADRQEEIIRLLQTNYGNLEVICLRPKANTEAKRVIIRAYKYTPYTIHTHTPLILHKPEGGYSDEAENVLRHMKAIEWA